MSLVLINLNQKCCVFGLVYLLVRKKENRKTTAPIVCERVCEYNAKRGHILVFWVRLLAMIKMRSDQRGWVQGYGWMLNDMRSGCI